MKYRVGDKYEKKYIIQEADGMAYAEVSGDYNPIHLDEETASKTRFGRKIAHGMLVGGYISSIIGNDFPGNGSVYMSQNLSFRAPVFYGEAIKIIVEISEIIKEKNRIILSTKCLDSHDKLLVDGTAMVYKEDIE